MKFLKINFFILFFISLSFFISAQEVINLNGYDLVIPKDYFELKNAYIVMAKNYIESEESLQKSLENFKNLKKEYDKIIKINKTQETDIETLTDRIENSLFPHIESLEYTINDLSLELKKALKTSIIRVSPVLLYQTNPQNTILNRLRGSLGVSIDVLESFKVEAYFNSDLSFSVGLGYMVFSY